MFVVILQDLACGALYRAMTYASPSEETAMIGSGVFTAVALSLGWPVLYAHLHGVALALSYAAAESAHDDPLAVRGLSPASPMVDTVLLLLSR